MVSTTNLLIVVASVVFFSYKGYRKGLLNTILGIVGLAVAYVVSFAYGSALVQYIANTGVNPALSLLGYPALFFGVTTVFSLIPHFIPDNYAERLGLKKQGAALGAVIGIVVGLVAVWGLGFVTSVSATRSIDSVSTSSVADIIAQEKGLREGETINLPKAPYGKRASRQKDVIALAADKLVSKTVEVSVAAVSNSESDLQAKTMAAVMKNPAAVLGGAQQVMQSPELKNFWSSPEAQYMMATNDLEALTQNQDFQQLMAKPGFNSMAEAFAEELSPEQQAQGVDKFVASQMTYTWQRMQTIQNSPEVQALATDPEIQALVAEGNPMKLLTHPKIQSLVKLVTQAPHNPESIDYTQFVQQPFDAPREAVNAQQQQRKPARKVPIYKWVDDSGQIIYSEGDQVPIDKLEEAEIIEF